ncbi:hypothetical protein FDECE_4412 [Fusarium decemcellulare]|nr:hypothetical protein FDECE_4412 [Fusarium decemcellulare]
MTALLSLLLPAAAAACVISPRADNQTSTNGTDNTPWVPSCKLPASNAYFNVGFGSGGECAPSKGTLRGYMIFVDFFDAESSDWESPEQLRDFFLPDAAEWFKTASYGALDLDINADVSKFYRMPNSAASYNWDDGLTWNQHYNYIQDVLQAYINNGTQPVPAETDILYVVPTRSASSWMTRSEAFNYRVWTRDSEYVALKAVTFGTDPFSYWGFKALNHETGHSMCLPDLYPLDGGDIGEFVGGWSAMGNLGGVGSDFFAWDKWRLGWLSDDDIDCVMEHGTSEHTLTPLGTIGGTKAVVIAANKTSAVVAEVRTAEGLDRNVCAPGVLLYTIDTTVATGEGPIHVLDATPNSPGCGDGNLDGLNDGTLSLSGGSTSIDVPGWGLKVTLVENTKEKYKIRVEYS